MKPEHLLQIARQQLRASPPPGLQPEQFDAYLARHRDTLIAQIARSIPAGADEPAFTRWRAEHRVARRLLVRLSSLTDQYFEPQPALAAIMQGIHKHNVYEERVLFPYLRRHLPELGPVLDQARQEHPEVAKALRATQRALRRGGDLDFDTTESILQHFDDEERSILLPARQARLLATPSGGTSELLAADGTLRSLRFGEHSFFIFPEPTRAFYQDARSQRREVLVPESAVCEVIQSQFDPEGGYSDSVWLEFWFEGRRVSAYSYGPVVPPDEFDEEEEEDEDGP